MGKIAKITKKDPLTMGIHDNLENSSDLMQLEMFASF